MSIASVVYSSLRQWQRRQVGGWEHRRGAQPADAYVRKAFIQKIRIRNPLAKKPSAKFCMHTETQYKANGGQVN